MLLHIIRALFILLMAAVGYSFVVADPGELGDLQGNAWLMVAASLVLGVLVLSVDILSERRKLAVFSGIFFGVLVGVSLAYALSFVVRLVVDQAFPDSINTPTNRAIVNFINLLVGTVCCYLTISFILQTKDDFRFIIPYVEFRRDARGNRPTLLDTSALIDGRIIDVGRSGFLESRLMVPTFVVQELQTLADHHDRLKRSRGRRGLEVLTAMQDDRRLDVVILDNSGELARTFPIDDHPTVDQRLLNVAKELDARLMTTDFNLSKVAQVAGLSVLNLNDLVNALKSEFLPGEVVRVHVIRRGDEPGQGVGYLSDGTMVVIEEGGKHVDEDVTLTVTNTRTTSQGRMIFGRVNNGRLRPGAA